MTKEQLFAEEKVCNGKCQDDIDKNYVHCKDCAKIKYFLAGLHEGQPKWHDLRKNPNDLPTTPKDADEWKTVLGQDGNLWFYNENERSWYTIGDDNEWGTGTHTPIAWCEIPQFKEQRK